MAAPIGCPRASVMPGLIHFPSGDRKEMDQLPPARCFTRVDSEYTSPDRTAERQHPVSLDVVDQEVGLIPASTRGGRRRSTFIRNSADDGMR